CDRYPASLTQPFLRSLAISRISCFFFFHPPSTPQIYTLSLHDALPISTILRMNCSRSLICSAQLNNRSWPMVVNGAEEMFRSDRSEEHTSELQSRFDLVCRLLLEKKKKKIKKNNNNITDY